MRSRYWMGGCALGLTAFVASATLFAAESGLISWRTNYRQAYEQRTDQGLPLLVFVTAEACPHCHRMLDVTYADRDVAREVAGGFVPALVNASEQEELAKRFGVRIYPTTFVVGPDNRIVDRIEGYLEPEAFRLRLATATKRLASQTPAVTR